MTVREKQKSATRRLWNNELLDIKFSYRLCKNADYGQVICSDKCFETRVKDFPNVSEIALLSI